MVTDSDYLSIAIKEHQLWRTEMLAAPSVFAATTRGFQRRLNNVIPESIHRVITKAVKETTQAVISGSAVFTLPKEHLNELQAIEAAALERIKFYSVSSATEGAITGFGGFISGLADFPLWLSLKMKLLFELSNLYGHNIDDYRERLYILYIFQLTFCAPDTRRSLFDVMDHWDHQVNELPVSYEGYDWKKFQLEYRDHIDLAKLIQLIPGFGAIAGAMVNHKYTKILGENAMNCFRLRESVFRDDFYER